MREYDPRRFVVIPRHSHFVGEVVCHLMCLECSPDADEAVKTWRDGSVSIVDLADRARDHWGKWHAGEGS